MPRYRFLLAICLASLAMIPAWVRAEDAGVQFSDTLQQRLLGCSGCHGDQGEGRRETEYYPRIAGKPAMYLYRQLANFRDGKRSYPQMVYMTRYLSDEYLLEIATYYSKLKPGFPTPIRTSASKEALARGETLVRQGDQAAGIPACAACHGMPLTGMQPGIPGIIGLYPDYISAQIGAWQRGARHATEPDCMAKVAAKLNGADISAVANYLAQQPGTPTTVADAEGSRKLPIACGSQGK